MSVVAHGGVESDYPELAEVSFLVATMRESVAASAHKRLVRRMQFLRSDASVALGAFQDILASLIRHYTSFDSCHIKLVISRSSKLLRTRAREKAGAHLSAQIDSDRAALRRACRATLFRIEMILTLYAHH